MPSHHRIQCRCGALQGFVSPTRPAVRCICYCEDCQGYARWLRATALLGPTGGTELIQLSPSQVAITSGKDRVACLRLTEHGLLRWYARCCLTPIANTAADRRVSLIRLARTCLGNDAGALEASFGPVSLHLNTDSALGNHKVPRAGRYRGALSAGWIRWASRASGEFRYNPFFDRVTGRPIAEPRTLAFEIHDDRPVRPAASQHLSHRP